MTTWKIPLADLTFDEREVNAVVDVLKSGWLTMGAVTREFEDQFASWNHTPHAIALSSCTAALHIACMALDLGPGDEVVLPSLTFVATANAVRYTGATPIFVDIESQEDLTISPEAIRAQVTEKTRAIIVMHYGGYPCNMPEIQKIADEFNLFIIEDAAHAVGTKLNGQFMGTVSDIGCYSFFSNKNLATGEGGMIVTPHDEIAARIQRLRSHGMTTLTWDRHQGHAFSYDVTDLGYNYRMDEMRAALGISQLQKLEKNNEVRRSLVDYYHQQLAERCPHVMVPFTRHPGIHAGHIMPVLLPSEVSRKKVMEHLGTEKIQTSIHYPPIHKFSNFQSEDQDRFSLQITEEVASRELTLPLYPHLRPEQIDEVVSALAEAIQ